MARVIGLGGVFVKTQDKPALGAWYQKHLGIEYQEWGGAQFHWRGKEDGKDYYSVWSLFSAASKYFEPSTKPFMLNFLVDDLHGMLAQLRADGVTVMDKVEDGDFGKFGWAVDPEGTKMELWQPPLAAAGDAASGDGAAASGFDIQHAITIAESPSQIWPFVTTGEGLSRWWAEDVAPGEGGALELGFMNRATVYRLRPGAQVLDQSVEWMVESGEQWNGTRLVFTLEPKGANTRVRFTHAGWRERTDYFVDCTTVWGRLMARLKRAAEGAETGPFFTMSGVAE